MYNQIDIAQQIGIITELIDDENVYFITNNNVKSVIGTLVALNIDNENYVIAEIRKIDTDFYLENSKQYFISKAVDNNISKLGVSSNQPRYGQYISAKILGHYFIDFNGLLTQVKNTINRYTPYIFQPVYLIGFDLAIRIYGLNDKNAISTNSLFSLGTLVFPQNENVSDTNLFFTTETFKRHTLITGVTGSGKSRLSALIIKFLASCGSHVNVLDPHNEYTSLLKSTEDFTVNYITSNNITFSERLIDPNSLSKLLPSLSEQQVEVIFDAFNQVKFPITLEKLLRQLLENLYAEINKEYPRLGPQLLITAKELNMKYREFPIFIVGIINHIKREILDPKRVNKLDVFVAVINKLNELRLNGLMSNVDPSWLVVAPNTIDIFNIDYSSNNAVRRFINSIIQFLLRRSERKEDRILVIDEAHMLFAEKSETSSLLIQLLREARKFGITVIFISQNIKDIPIEIIGQFQNLFTFRQKENNVTSFYADQICNVSLYSSKLDFSMRVSDIKLAQ